jgi:histidine triad (HIT) family protein
LIRDTVAMECLLCRIVARTEDASIAYEDDQVLALCDLYPVNPGHLLVVPKTHAVGLADLGEADGRRMFTIGQALAAAIRKTDLRCDGINLFLADGAAAFQEVFHVHLHVIPRYAGDSFRLYTGQSSTPTPRSDLDAVASQVRALLFRRVSGRWCAPGDPLRVQGRGCRGSARPLPRWRCSTPTSPQRGPRPPYRLCGWPGPLHR